MGAQTQQMQAPQGQPQLPANDPILQAIAQQSQMNAQMQPGQSPQQMALVQALLQGQTPAVVAPPQAQVTNA